MDRPDLTRETDFVALARDFGGGLAAEHGYAARLEEVG
jgi:hypothetical protein